MIFFTISLFFCQPAIIFAQDSESVYVETITITMDSQELLSMEQEIEEIPIDYELITLSENFIMSYEQLTLNVIEFKYDLNYYFANFIYNTLLGYSALLYYSKSYGSTFFQGFYFFEVYSYLPFSGFHFFKNSFELQRNLVDWNLEYSLSFESYSLPGTESLSEYSSIFSHQLIKGINGNFDFLIELKTLSIDNHFSFYFLENTVLNYKLRLNSNIYLKLTFKQFYNYNLILKPEISLIYDFPTLDFTLAFSYNIFMDNFNGMVNLLYENESLKFSIFVEKGLEFDLLNYQYLYLDNYISNLFSDFVKTKIAAEFKKNNVFLIGLDGGYYYYWKNTLLKFNNTYQSFYLSSIEDSWIAFFKLYLDWEINEIIKTSFQINLKLPSYYEFDDICETFFGLLISLKFDLTEFSNLRFSINSEIFRSFLGINDPIYKIEIEYRLEKADYDISLLLALNLNQYNILPNIIADIINIKIFSQIFF